MKLNLITPLYRAGNIGKVAASIPAHSDINWIIVVCDEREDLKDECAAIGLQYITIPFGDVLSSVNKKVNAAISASEYGFIQGIDDDTTFNHNSYELFRKWAYKKMIIGMQVLQDGTTRPAQKPKHCYTDGAQALIHTDIVKRVTFGDFTTDPVADCNFMLHCWDMCEPDEIVIVDEVISNYNFLR